MFQELARERQETSRLLKAHQDKDDLIGKLKEEVDLLNRVSPARRLSGAAASGKSRGGSGGSVLLPWDWLISVFRDSPYT